MSTYGRVAFPVTAAVVTGLVLILQGCSPQPADSTPMTELLLSSAPTPPGSAPEPSAGDGGAVAEPPLVPAVDGLPDGPAVPVEEPVAPPAEVFDVTIAVDAGRIVRRIPAEIYGTNIEWVFDGNGIWDAGAGTLNSRIVSHTRSLGTPLLRFPGGVFSDYYHWMDGVGPLEERRTSEHYPDGPSSRHIFGTDEALAFASATGASLLITVNAGTGTPEEAADWVRYANGRVPLWEVGNELYINDGSPTAAPVALTPAEYAERFLAFADAMRAADPGIRIAAIGGQNQGAYTASSWDDWNETLLRTAGDRIDVLAVHNAYAPAPFVDRGEDVRTVYRAMLAAPLLVRRNLDTLDVQLRSYAADTGRIGIAITEWGPFFHALPSSRYVDHVKTLGSALNVASMLKVFAEHPRVEAANAFKLVDNAFQGWIGLRDGAYVPKAPCMAMQMFTQNFGRDLVRVSVTSPTYDSSAVGFIDAVADVPYLEAVASLGSDGTLFLLAINRHFDQALRASIELSGFEPQEQARTWTLSGTGIDANTGTQLPQIPGIIWARQATDAENPRFNSGGPGEVAIRSGRVSGVAKSFAFTFPAASVTSIELKPVP